MENGVTPKSSPAAKVSLQDKTLNIHHKNKVAQRWGESAPCSEVNFYTFGPVMDYMLQCVSGEPDAQGSDGWFEQWAIKEFLHNRTPVDECLSLCCGFGAKDRRLARFGVFRRCTAIDFSEGAIQGAKASAAAAGIDNIDYRVADLDTADLGQEKYDLVYASGALHHISRLEHVVEEIHRCLKPGGILLSDEYVGPAYNDFSHRHREVVNAAMHLIPGRLRHARENTFVPRQWQSPPWKRGLFELLRLVTLRPLTFNFEGFQVPATWPAYKRCIFALARRVSTTLANWQAQKPVKFRFGQIWDSAPEKIRRDDPSEGVRSDEIIPVVKSIFPDTTVRYFNGSILHFALDRKFFANYDPDRDLPILQLLMEVERTMIDLQEIPPILAVIVARK
jgi:SAM-dependent methyltransferase